MTTEITKLDSKTVNRIEKQINERLAELSEELGINIIVSGGSFSKVEATLKLKIQVPNPDSPEVFTKESEDFKNYAHLLGMEPSDLGKTFKKFGGETYTIEGYRTRARKNPILVKQTLTGKMYVFSIEAVKHHLATTGGKLKKSVKDSVFENVPEYIPDPDPVFSEGETNNKKEGNKPKIK